MTFEFPLEFSTCITELSVIHVNPQVYLPSGRGPRYILYAAGSKNGWVSKPTVFQHKDASSDYNNGMNGAHFEVNFLILYSNNIPQLCSKFRVNSVPDMHILVAGCTDLRTCIPGRCMLFPNFKYYYNYRDEFMDIQQGVWYLKAMHSVGA